MRKSFIVMFTSALFCLAGTASAQEAVSETVIVTPPVVVTPAPTIMEAPPKNLHPVRIGFGMDIGVPSGLSVGLVVHPATDYLSLGASFSENVLSPGGRLALKVEPFAFAPRLPVGLFAEGQVGFFGRGTFPGHSTDLPSFGYSYENLFLGLRLGRVTGFNWFFEGGVSHMNVSTSNFSTVVDSNVAGLTLGNPSASAWIAPAFATGFSIVWR